MTMGANEPILFTAMRPPHSPAANLIAGPHRAFMQKKLDRCPFNDFELALLAAINFRATVKGCAEQRLLKKQLLSEAR